MIDRATIDRVLDSAQILDVVSDFVSLKKKGQNYWGLCPFHSDRSPSFSVSPSRNMCKCFSCGEGGSPLHFIMKHESLSYADAIKYLAKKYNIEIIEKEISEEDKKQENERQSLFIINEFAKKFFEDSLLNKKEGQDIGLSYFRERGMNAELINKFGLGYSPSQKDALYQEAKNAGYNIDRLIDLGLIIKYEDENNSTPRFVDRFRDRVIFPIYNISGRVVGFGGRIMVQNEKRGKYVNSPESPIYSKSNELYGLYQAKQSISKLDKAYLVEGYFDVISMYQSGITNVVASSGTALTDRQVQIISRFTKNVTLIYDGDKAGIKAALRGVDLLLRQDIKVKVLLLPEDMDPDLFAQTHTSKEFEDYIAQNEVDFITFKSNLLGEEIKNDPLRKSQVISELLSSIALIPDTIISSIYIKSLSERFQISEQILNQELKKIKYKLSYSQHPERTNTQREPIQEDNKADDEEIENNNKKEDNKNILRSELDIIKILMALGNKKTLEKSQDEDGNIFIIESNLVSFVKEEINKYGINSELNALIINIIDEIEANIIPYDNIDCLKYFTNHQNALFREIANTINFEEYKNKEVETYYNQNDIQDKDLIIERELSLSNKLRQRVSKEITDFNMTLIMKHIENAKEAIKEAQANNDIDEMMRLIKLISDLNEIKSTLALELGERTIIG